VLSKLGAKSTNELIELSLSADTSTKRRVLACKAMGELGYSKFGPALLHIARNSKGSLAQAAEAAIQRIPPRWRLKRMRDLVRAKGEFLRKRLGVAEEGELLALALDKSRPQKCRVNACGALGFLRRRSTRKKLVQLITDEDTLVANAAAHALINIGKPDVVPMLIDTIRHSKKRNAKIEAIYVVGSFPNRATSVAALAQILRDTREHEDVRARAASSLHNFTIPAARSDHRRSKDSKYSQIACEALRRATNDPSAKVRYRALEALSSVLMYRKSPQTLQVFKARISDSDPTLAALARESLQMCMSLQDEACRKQ